jgi:hypothetical protein
MEKDEFDKKYSNLRILKSVQEYFKSDTANPTAVYPIRVPDDLLYQFLQREGSEKTDELIHDIFKTGLTIWSEKLYTEAFGTQENLEAFIELVKKRNKE